MSNSLYLLVSSSDGQKVLVDKELIIGRDKNCAVVLAQGHASRQHAKLSPGENGIIVEDLNSTNGTKVNGIKITKPVVLKVGDELVIGKESFTASLAAESSPVDPDATMLFSVSDVKAEAKAETNAEKESNGDNNPPLANTLPETPVAEDPPASAAPVDSNAPPSWVLSNQQAVDGTKFIDKKIMQDVLAQSSGASKEKVEIPTLIGSSEPIAGMRFQLTGDGVGQWEIGRSPNCQVMINHDSVSSNHAQIINEKGRWKLVDLMSANGTYVNAKKGLSSYLSSGDVLRFGHVECTFMLPGSAVKVASVKVTAVKSDDAKKKGNTIKTALIAFAVTGALVIAVIFALSLRA